MPFVPTISTGILAAKIFPLELLEVFFGEHSALSLLLLLLVLRLGHQPVTGFAPLVLLQDLEIQGKGTEHPVLEAQRETFEITGQGWTNSTLHSGLGIARILKNSLSYDPRPL